MKLRFLLKLLLALLVLGAVCYPVYYPVLLIHYTRWINEDDYPRRKDRYEVIIAALKKMELPGPSIVCFYIAADREPSSLRRLKDEEVNRERFDFTKTGSCAQASRLEDGSIIAIFFNKDLGPFGGTFVTIHSPIIPSSAQIGLQGVFKEVAPNWWAGHID